MRKIVIAVIVIISGISCKGNTEKKQEYDSSGNDIALLEDSDVIDYDCSDTCQYVQPVVPPFVKNLIKGSEWVADTLCVAKNKVYYRAYDGFGNTYVIYDNERVWIEDPTLRVDSFAPGCKDKLYVSVTDKTRLIDFSNMQSVRGLESLAKLLPSFTRFRKDSIAGFGQTVYYCLTAEYPNKSVTHADEIRRWLVNKITDSQLSEKESRYKGDLYNPQQIAEHVSELYFSMIKSVYGSDKEVYPFYLYSILDLRAKVMNNRFVTYQRFRNDYEGGIHGYYTERLISYDHVHQQEIDFGYLFNPGCKKELLEILLKEAKDYHQYDYWEPNIEEYVYVTDNNWEPTGELKFPQPGLSEKGVVFSFQPYDISCFAAGCFLYTIPYGKIKHLLTQRGKWCAGI